MIPEPIGAMIPEPIKHVIALSMFCFLSAVSFAGGWYVTRSHYEAEISKMERDTAIRDKAVAEANTAALTEANARSDKAIADLARLEQTRLQQSQEHQREIKRLTTGRACLSGELVRVLNTKSLPNGQRAAVQSPATADAGSATDTDVAEWIDTAKLYYGRCQDRVNALIQFHEGSGLTAN